MLRYYVFGCTDHDVDWGRVYKNGSTIHDGCGTGNGRVNTGYGTINFVAGDTISWWSQGDWNSYYKSIMVVVGYYFD